MNRHTGLAVLFVLAAFHWTVPFALAKPVEQIVTLNSGWNAVFLEVEPADVDNHPSVVFAGLGADLLSVWAWNSNAGTVDTVEYIQNPNELIDTGSQMLNYQPGNPGVSNLHAIRGNQAYLIQMANPLTGAGTLAITGEPKVPDVNWKPNSFNFVGFHVDVASPPNFHDFFKSSSAHNGDFVADRTEPEIYVLDNATSSWVEVPFSEAMKKGEGFWIYTKGSSEFNGPVSVQLERADGLHYGDTLTTQDVVFNNDSASEKTISLSLPANGVPLYYWNVNTANNIPTWSQFPSGNMNLVIAAGESQRLSLGVNRSMILATEANIGVTDSQGTSFEIPVSVASIDYAGLWVGQAVINKVSEVRINNTPVPTGTEFSFRLIVHLDETAPGTARLLSEVFQMWDEQIPPGPVLFTDDALIPNYSGATLRDGKPVGRRISSPAFNNFKQQEMGGAFGQQDSTLTVTLVLPVDDPANPFVHRFHPDHLLPDLDTPPERQFAITRDISMTFQDTDADGNNIVGNSGLGWGSSDMGGIYEETLEGLNKAPIYVKGFFLLHKVSDVGTLSE